MREWEQQIPHIQDGNVRWAVLRVHNVEEYWDFEVYAAEIRETCRKDPERREKYEEAYRYLVEHTPSPREWGESTHTPFCSRAQLHEYFKAFYDYVFGERAAPIVPPNSEEPCEHESGRNEDGECLDAVADRAQEENR